MVATAQAQSGKGASEDCSTELKAVRVPCRAARGRRPPSSSTHLRLALASLYYVVLQSHVQSHVQSSESGDYITLHYMYVQSTQGFRSRETRSPSPAQITPCYEVLHTAATSSASGSDKLTTGPHSPPLRRSPRTDLACSVLEP